MAIKLFNRKRFNLCSNKGDKWIIFRPEHSKKKIDHFKIIQWLVHGDKDIDKALKFLIIISNVRVTLLKG